MQSVSVRWAQQRCRCCLLAHLGVPGWEGNPGEDSGALTSNADVGGAGTAWKTLGQQELRGSDSRALDPKCREVLGRPYRIYFMHMFLFNLQVIDAFINLSLGASG